MKTRRKLLPSQPGTKKPVDQYGEDLVCVRYRYDPEQNVAVKTIELIVERGPWRKYPSRIPGHKIVHVRVDYGEVELGRMVKASGGQWNRERKLWRLPYGKALALGLIDRIISDGDEGAKHV